MCEPETVCHPAEVLGGDGKAEDVRHPVVREAQLPVQQLGELSSVTGEQRPRVRQLGRQMNTGIVELFRQRLGMAEG
jgi:hypothetical protein